MMFLLQVPIHDVIENIPTIDLQELQEQLDFQTWMKNIGVLEMVFKGLLIGIFASAPMGPVGVLCVRRTLSKGRWIGFATGVGASLSDIIYALITGLGLSFIVDTIEDPIIAYWMKIVGSVIFLLFGVYTFMSNPVSNMKPVTKTKTGTLAQNFLTGFLVTFSNPLIIVFFGTLFSMFTFILVDNVVPQVVGYISIFIGALLWWFLLAFVIDKVRKTNNIRFIKLLNRAIGVAVMIVSALMLTYALTGHSFPMLND